MPTPYRQNPFYQYRNPYIGNAVNGLASAMFPDQGSDAARQAAAMENEAQARQADAAASMSRERTRGYRNTNDAMAVDPTSIAELLLSGGILQDDPLKSNPNYQPPAPVNFGGSLLDVQAPTQDSSLFLPNRTANDKMAAAIQEAAIRKIPLDQVLKSAGIAEYLRRIQGQAPDSALGLAPFAGIHSPNDKTALTTGRQDAVSARDSAEEIAKQATVNDTNIQREKLQQSGAKEREGMQQSGANWRTKYNKDNDPVAAGANTDVFITKAQADKLGIKANADGQYVISGKVKVGTGQDIMPGTGGGDAVSGREKTTQPGAGKGPSAVPVAASKRMQAKIDAALKAQGITVDQASMDGLMSEAGATWQQNKNPDAAADSIIQRLTNGESVNGVTMKKDTTWYGGDDNSVKRSSKPPGSASAPMPAAAKPASANDDPISRARDAIARGADRNAVIKRLRDNGIDPKGL